MISFRRSITSFRVRTEPAAAYREAEMCTSGSRHASHTLPALCVPSKRLLVRRELVQRWWHRPVNRRIGSPRQGNQPQETNTFLRRQGRDQRENIIGRQMLGHRLHSTTHLHQTPLTPTCLLLPVRWPAYDDLLGRKGRRLVELPPKLLGNGVAGNFDIESLRAAEIKLAYGVRPGVRPAHFNSRGRTRRTRASPGT